MTIDESIFKDVLKVVSTTSDKLDSIEVTYGQLIFSRDDRVIYFDTEERTTYQAIISVATEEYRKKLVRPVNGYYFVEETGAIWKYDNSRYSKWFQVTTPPKDYVIFNEKSNFPTIGSEDVLYVDRDVIYRYIDGEYVEMNSLKWGQF